MPATEFKCPDGTVTKITDCLEHCPNSSRCMFLPTLKAIAKSLNRNLEEPTITELLQGTRETYLKKVTNYSVDPFAQYFALHGTAVHNLHNENSDNMLAEIRLYDGVMSGQFDVFGKVLNNDTNTLGDYKVTTSYKAMKVLGYYKVDIPTGEVYKTGVHKGEPKFRKEWRTDGIRDVLEWTIQLNYYRMLLETRGFKVGNMYIQMIVRDYSTRIAAERNITLPVYIVPIRRISDHWLKLYLQTKAQRLKEALTTNNMPKPCTSKENWNGRKCVDYCAVAEHCPYGAGLKARNEGLAA